MADIYRHQFVQASNSSETLTSVTAAYYPTNLRDDTNFRFSIVIYSATAITGNIQGGILSEAGADIQWGNIQGGDLSDADFTNGGATQITCKYDAIRINVTGGTGKIRLMY